MILKKVVWSSVYAAIFGVFLTVGYFSGSASSVITYGKGSLWTLFIFCITLSDFIVKVFYLFAAHPLDNFHRMFLPIR